MRIIKRNGSEVEFNSEKIYSAVFKANEAVEPASRISESDIQRVTRMVTEKCESLGRTPEVEEVQDMVEREIMTLGAFTLAKTYITYRYTRELVRKSNTTDERIMSLIECKNEDIKRFCDTLAKQGINATVRRRLGPDINASCGQLRRGASSES